MAPHENQAGLVLLYPSLSGQDQWEEGLGNAAHPPPPPPMAPGLPEVGWSVEQDGWKARGLGALAALFRLQDTGGAGQEGLGGSLEDFWRKLGDGLRTLRVSARATMRGGQVGLA